MITTFIRGKDKHLSVLLNLDTMTVIPNVAWADEENGTYGIWAVDSLGKLVLSPSGGPGVEERTGNIQILRVVQEKDYRILGTGEPCTLSLIRFPRMKEGL